MTSSSSSPSPSSLFSSIRSSFPPLHPPYSSSSSSSSSPSLSPQSSLPSSLPPSLCRDIYSLCDLPPSTDKFSSLCDLILFRPFLLFGFYKDNDQQDKKTNKIKNQRNENKMNGENGTETNESETVEMDMEDDNNNNNNNNSNTSQNTSNPINNEEEDGEGEVDEGILSSFVGETPNSDENNTPSSSSSSPGGQLRADGSSLSFPSLLSPFVSYLNSISSSTDNDNNTDSSSLSLLRDCLSHCLSLIPSCYSLLLHVGDPFGLLNSQVRLLNLLVSTEYLVHNSQSVRRCAHRYLYSVAITISQSKKYTLSINNPNVHSTIMAMESNYLYGISPFNLDILHSTSNVRNEILQEGDLRELLEKNIGLLTGFPSSSPLDFQSKCQCVTEFIKLRPQHADRILYYLLIVGKSMRQFFLSPSAEWTDILDNVKMFSSPPSKYSLRRSFDDIKVSLVSSLKFVLSYGWNRLVDSYNAKEDDTAPFTLILSHFSSFMEIVGDLRVNGDEVSTLQRLHRERMTRREKILSEKKRAQDAMNTSMSTYSSSSPSYSSSSSSSSLPSSSSHPLVIMPKYEIQTDFSSDDFQILYSKLTKYPLNSLTDVVVAVLLSRYVPSEERKVLPLSSSSSSSPFTLSDGFISFLNEITHFDSETFESKRREKKFLEEKEKNHQIQKEEEEAMNKNLLRPPPLPIASASTSSSLVDFTFHEVLRMSDENLRPLSNSNFLSFYHSSPSWYLWISKLFSNEIIYQTITHQITLHLGNMMMGGEESEREGERDGEGQHNEMDLDSILRSSFSSFRSSSSSSSSSPLPLPYPTIVSSLVSSSPFRMFLSFIFSDFSLRISLLMSFLNQLILFRPSELQIIFDVSEETKEDHSHDDDDLNIELNTNSMDNIIEPEGVGMSLGLEMGHEGIGKEEKKENENEMSDIVDDKSLMTPSVNGKRKSSPSSCPAERISRRKVSIRNEMTKIPNSDSSSPSHLLLLSQVFNEYSLHGSPEYQYVCQEMFLSIRKFIENQIQNEGKSSLSLVSSLSSSSSSSSDSFAKIFSLLLDSLSSLPILGFPFWDFLLLLITKYLSIPMVITFVRRLVIKIVEKRGGHSVRTEGLEFLCRHFLSPSSAFPSLVNEESAAEIADLLFYRVGILKSDSNIVIHLANFALKNIENLSKKELFSDLPEIIVRVTVPEEPIWEKIQIGNNNKENKENTNEINTNDNNTALATIKKEGEVPSSLLPSSLSSSSSSPSPTSSSSPDLNEILNLISKSEKRKKEFERLKLQRVMAISEVSRMNQAKEERERRRHERITQHLTAWAQMLPFHSELLRDLFTHYHQMEEGVRRILHSQLKIIVENALNKSIIHQQDGSTNNASSPHSLSVPERLRGILYEIFEFSIGFHLSPQQIGMTQQLIFHFLTIIELWMNHSTISTTSNTSNNNKDDTTLSSLFIDFCKKLSLLRPSDSKFLIPIIGSLSTEEIIRLVPRMIAMSPFYLKISIQKLLDAKPSKISPVQFLCQLHFIQTEKRGTVVKSVSEGEFVDEAQLDSEVLKRVIAASSFCLSHSSVNNDTTLKSALTLLSEISPPPRLFMRTLIQSIQMRKSSKGFKSFCLEILRKLARPPPSSPLISPLVFQRMSSYEGWTRAISLLGDEGILIVIQLRPQEIMKILKYPKGLGNIQNLKAKLIKTFYAFQHSLKLNHSVDQTVWTELHSNNNIAGSAPTPLSVPLVSASPMALITANEEKPKENGDLKGDR